MGTWGYELEQDDFVCDVMAEFEHHLKSNQDVQKTTQLVLTNNQDVLNDVDEGPLFWLTLASMQWKFGKVDDKVLEKIKNDFDKKAGLERWQEIGEVEYNRRKQVLANFIEKVSTENPKPKKLPKIVVRKPAYQAGDCLAIKLTNNMYGAALVLVSDHSNIEDGQNLIGLLNYMENSEPDLAVFEKRDFLICTHHNWEGQPDICWYSSSGYRSEKKRFTFIGNIAINQSDPKEGHRYSQWNLLGEQVVSQKKWGQNQ